VKVSELIARIEEFQTKLNGHHELWGQSLDRSIPEYPIRNGPVLREQARWLSRQHGALRPYIEIFDRSWLMQHPATGVTWDALEAATGLSAVAPIKGPSLRTVSEKLDRILGRLQTYEQDDHIPDPHRPIQCGIQSGMRNDMNLTDQCNEKVTIEKQDASRYEQVSAMVTDKMVLVPDVKIPIEPGDAILRELPSGIVERLTITEPGFHAQFHGIQPHYQVKYRREGKKPAGTPGYIFHVSGENARVNIHSTDQSSNVVTQQTGAFKDLNKLADELGRLREALLRKAEGPEHYATIGMVASAEVAAKSGERSKVAQALSALGAGGRWVLEAAKEIGVQVATEALKKQIGS
jgi:hypothetical protein